MADEIDPKTNVKRAAPEPAQPPQGPMNKPLLVGCIVLALLGLIGVTELTRPRPNSTPAKSAARTKAESDTASTVDITKFQRQTQQEAQELARIQAQKEALQRTLEAAQQGPVPNLTNSNASPSQGADLNTLAGLQHQQQLAAAGYYQPAQQGGASPAEQEATERRKKEEQALHASNVALDLRGKRFVTACFNPGHLIFKGAAGFCNGICQQEDFATISLIAFVMDFCTMEKRGRVGS